MRRVTFVVILGLVILLLFGCGERQASITGVVADSESGNPLRDATITLGEHTAKTGADGHYQLDKVPPGSYTLTTRVEGYNPYQRQLDVGGGQEVVLDINLSSLEEPSPLPVAEIEQAPHRMIERVSSAISPQEGGSIAITEAESIYSNGFTLSIPPGALEEETVITIWDITDDFPPIPKGLRPVGLPISLEPDGLSFQEPVTIKIPYSDEMLAWAGITSPEELLLKTYDLSAGEWADVPIAHVDTEDRLVVARIDHFSLFSLFSWWNRKETENPATDEQITTYINESWGIVTSTGDLLEKLEYPNPTTAIPFRQEIGGILAVMAMAEQVRNGEYRKAAITGGEWLAWQALKAVGYGWLRPFALFVEVTYKGGEWFVKEVDKNAFNSQVCAYLYYRNEGYSDEEIQRTFGFVDDEGWLLTTGTGCPPWRPRLTGRFQPEDVFKIGRAVWNAKQSGSYKQRDIESIRNAFIDAIQPPEPNQPPQVRIISPSQGAVFTAGDIVNLKGTAIDPEDGPLTGSSLTWRIETAGSSTFLGEGEALSLSELSVGTHRIFLTAEDSQGQTAEDSIEITVQATANLLPQVTISTPSDGSVFVEGDPISFTGSAIDPEDGPLADRSLVWVSGIDGVLGPGHTVTRDDLSPGTHAITLSATDSRSMFSTKTVTITIKPSTPNEAPIADAGPDQTVYVGTTVNLDGSASYDPDNDVLAFRWTQSGGPSVTLSNSTLQKLTFTPMTAGTYNFRLTVNDGTLDSTPDHVSITVVKEPSVRQQDAVGEYINPLILDDCLEINTDGTCYMEIMGLNVGITGRWKVDNARISLLFPDGTTFRGTVKTDAILLEGFGLLPLVWIKTTKSPPRVPDIAGRYVKEGHPDEYLVLNAYGTYTKTERNMFDELWTESGDWELDNHAVLLHLEYGDATIAAAVLENCLYFMCLWGTDVWIGEPREEPTLLEEVSPVEAFPEPEEETVPGGGEPPEVEWERFFSTSGEDRGVTAQQTADGGYIVLGIVMSESNDYAIPVVWLIKTDALGIKEWEKEFSGGVLNYVQQTSDAGYILVGSTAPAHEHNQKEEVWLVKIDARGVKQWDKSFGRDEKWAAEHGYFVQQTRDSGFVIAAGSSRGVWIIKTDAFGNKEWDRSFFGNSRDWAESVQQTQDGGYILVGSTYSYGAGGADIWLIKTDSRGNKEWDRTFGGTSKDKGYSVQEMSTGGYVLTGETWSFKRGGPPDLWLIRTDTLGSKEWDKVFPSIGEYPSCVYETPDGGYLVCGSEEDETPSLWLTNLAPAGNVRWSQTYGENILGAYAQLTRDGGCIAVGTDFTGSGGGDIWLIKLKGTGVAPQTHDNATISELEKTRSPLKNSLTLKARAHSYGCGFCSG